MQNHIDHKGKSGVQNGLAAAAGRRMARAAILVCAIVLGAMAGAHADEAVVLASSSSNYASGSTVAESDTLRLPERASLTLLFRTGEMLRLRGPLDKSLAQLREANRSTSLQSLAAALRVSGVDAAVIGGTRAAGGRQVDKDEIAVALEQTATYCVGPAATLWLTRASTGAQLVGLQRAGTLREVRFPEAADRIEWPADVLLEDGDLITFLSNEGAPIGEARFRVANANSDLEWLAQLGLLGCTSQFSVARRELQARSLLPND
jgi:hypothetical protein